MANPVVKFGHPDQILINLIGFLMAERIESANTGLALTILAEVTPRATMSNHHMRPIIAAAKGLLAMAPTRHKPSIAGEWAKACLEARAAMETFFWWRAAQAYDAMNPQPEAAQ